MPAFHNPWKVILELNEVCRDLKWLKERPHYAEIKQPGHWNNMTCVCFDFFVWSMGRAMAEHLRDDMLTESWEAIRAAVVDATENGIQLRWTLGGETDAAVILASVRDGVVYIHMPTGRLATAHGNRVLA